MDTATSRSMTVLVGQGHLCPPAPFSRHSRSSCGTQTPSFPKYPPNPNAVIPRAVAESIFACQRISQRSQCPLHSSMDTATSRSMTVLVGQGRLCPRAPFSRHSRSTRRTQTPSFPKYPPNPNFVIPRTVAESIFACQRINQRNRRPRRSNRDAATSRSMTVQGLTPHSRSSENRKPKLATECLYLYIGIF